MKVGNLNKVNKVNSNTNTTNTEHATPVDVPPLPPRKPLSTLPPDYEEPVEVDSIVRVQALVRGWLLRRRFKKRGMIIERRRRGKQYLPLF